MTFPSSHPDSLLFCHLGSPPLSSRPTGEISLRFVSPLRVNRYNDEIPLCVRDDKGVVRDDKEEIRDDWRGVNP